MSRTGGRDRGSATVWALVAAGTLCAVFVTLLALAQAVTVRHRAGAVADLAALAAADHAFDGEPAACEQAERVARAQGARLVACALQGDVADVRTEVPGVGPAFVTGAVRARARAGPPWAEP